MRIFLCIALAFSIQGLQAQRVVDVNQISYNAGSFLEVVGGMPISNAIYVDLVSGSPFFGNEWLKSTIITEKGGVFKDVEAKLNLVNHHLHCINTSGKEIVVSTPLREVILQEKDKLIRFIDGRFLPVPQKGWYQLLVNGEVSLVKVFEKRVSENKSYGSATVEQRIKTEEKFLLFYNHKAYDIKKATELPGILSSKKEALESFLKNADQKTSKEELLINAVTFSNTASN